MPDTAKKGAPPYATYGSFVNFLNTLRETSIPSRIDPSVFGNASGSITYSILSALKSLKLINESGVPSERFRRLVGLSDEARKPLMRELLQEGYPTLWNGAIDLTTVTAGQFDEHIREEYGVKGSTIDKVAAFFISAANGADVPLSPHLKARKPTSPSSSSRKSAKQRKRTDGGDNGGASQPQPPISGPIAPLALEYQLIDLMKEPGVGDDVKQAIWTLVQYLAAKKVQDSVPPEGE